MWTALGTCQGRGAVGIRLFCSPRSAFCPQCMPSGSHPVMCVTAHVLMRGSGRGNQWLLRKAWRCFRGEAPERRRDRHSGQGFMGPCRQGALCQQGDTRSQHREMLVQKVGQAWPSLSLPLPFLPSFVLSSLCLFCGSRATWCCLSMCRWPGDFQRGLRPWLGCHL